MHTLIIRRPLRTLYGAERSLNEIPAGELIETTGNTVRKGMPNAMAEVVWREERHAAFVCDLEERTSPPSAMRRFGT